MFKIEGIKIVCSFFLYRREKPKLKTAKQACGGARENGSCSHHPHPQHFELFLESEDQEAFSMATTGSVPFTYK